MIKMKKINLKRVSSALSVKEMKNVLGGSGPGSGCTLTCGNLTIYIPHGTWDLCFGFGGECNGADVKCSGCSF